MNEQLEPQTRTIPDIGGRDLVLPKRSEIQKKAAEDIIGSGADEVFGGLFQVLGTTPIDHPHFLLPKEVNRLAAELILVRTAQDLLNGRAEALKKYATDVINLELEQQGKDFQNESGYLLSTEYNVRLSKEVTGNKLTLDVELLAKVLDPDQFNAIINVVETVTTTTYPDGRVTTNVSIVKQVNEEELERNLKQGNIGMEQLVQAAVPGKSRTAFYVRESK